MILLFSGSLIGRGYSPTARVTRGAWVPVLVSRLQRCVLILCNYREVNTDLIALQTNRKQKHCVCLTQQRSAHVAQRFAAIGVGAALLRQLQGNEQGGFEITISSRKWYQLHLPLSCRCHYDVMEMLIKRPLEMVEIQVQLYRAPVSVLCITCSDADPACVFLPCQFSAFCPNTSLWAAVTSVPSLSL